MDNTTTPGNESLFETPETLLELTPEQAALWDRLSQLARMSRSSEPGTVIEALGALHSEYRETLTPADPPTPMNPAYARNVASGWRGISSAGKSGIWRAIHAGYRCLQATIWDGVTC